MASGWHDGLRLGVDGLWHYRFAVKGRNYEGCTGHALKTKALAWVRIYRARLADAEVGLKDAPLVKDAFKSWLEVREGKVSDTHLLRARCAWTLHVLPHIGEYPADQVNSEVVELLLTRYLDKGRHTGHGANTLLIYVKAVFSHLVSLGYLKALPFRVKPIRVQQPVRAFVPPEKIIRFLAAVDRTGNLHQSVAVRAMLMLGLREHEALEMRWAWFSSGLSTYTPGDTKGREAWPLPVPPDLQAWLRECSRLSVWVLPAEDGLPHRPQFTLKAILRAGKDIGVQGLTPHRLRGTYATLLAKAGTSAHHIQRALRHKNISTTQRYVQVGLKDVAHAQDTLANLIHGKGNGSAG